MRHCMDIHFCAVMNDNAAVVLIKFFALLNVCYVQWRSKGGGAEARAVL